MNRQLIAVASTRRTPNRWLALGVLACAQLMLVLDVTVVNVALPEIGRGLGLNRAQLPWAITTYTLCFGGLMLLGGRIADLVGARRATMVGLAVFTASSLVCGLADGAAMLMAGRALQGIGAAVMSPAALATVMSLFSDAARTKAVGIWSGISGVGAALGVILGGVLTSEAGWRWVFTINAPIGVLLLVTIPLVAPTTGPADRSAGSLDIPGALLVTGGTAAMIYGLENAGTHGWIADSTVAAFLVAIACWMLLATVERRTDRPLLSLVLLTRRPSLAGSYLMLVATALMVGGFFIGSFALQRLHHYSAIHVGLAFLPMAVATVIGAHTAGHLLSRVNARVTGTTGLTLAGVGYGIAAEWPGAALATVVGLSVATLGIGAVFVTAFTAALTDSPGREAGLRSALVSTFHELGGAAGVAVLSTAAGSALVAIDPGRGGYRTAFVVGAIVAAIAVVAAPAVLPRVLRVRDMVGIH